MDDESLRLAEQLETEALKLPTSDGFGVLMPVPTLGAQASKLDSLERLAGMRPGSVPARVDPRHKRSEEAAVRSMQALERDQQELLNSYMVLHEQLTSPDADEDEGLGLPLDATVDTIAMYRHSLLLNSSLDKATLGSAEASKRLHWYHDHVDLTVATSRLSEVSKLRNEMRYQHRGLQLTSGALGNGPQSHWGNETRLGTDSVAKVEWRAEDFCKCVLAWRSGVATWAEAIDNFKSASVNGPHGPRDDCAPILSLWDALIPVLEGATKMRAEGVTRSQAMADCTRLYLEKEYRESLEEEAMADGMSDKAKRNDDLDGRDTVGAVDVIAASANNMQHRDPNRMGHHERPVWVHAYLCLRAGLIEECAEHMVQVGRSILGPWANHPESLASQLMGLGRELPDVWPPYTFELTTKRLVERTGASPTAQKLASELTDVDFEQNPFRCAVILILSRRTTCRDQAKLLEQIGRRYVFQYGQDKIWLHLALAVSDSHTGNEAYRLAVYQKMVQNAPVSTFSDVFLYCKAMLWSVAPQRAVTALVPPTIMESLSPYALEGMHMALLLVFNKCIEDPAIQQRVYRVLHEYLYKLLPYQPDVVVIYLGILPFTDSVVIALADKEDSCHALLGRIGPAGEVFEGPITQLYPAASERSGVYAAVAASLKARGSVLLVTEMMLLAVHTASDPIRVVRNLAKYLSARLTALVHELDVSVAPNVPKHETLQASSAAWPHLERFTGSVADVIAFKQLHVMALLSWSLKRSRGYEVPGLVVDLQKMGLFPACEEEVPRCAATANTTADAATIRRVLPIAASFAVAHLAELVRGPATFSGPWVTTANSLVLYVSQLEAPQSAETSGRIADARALLSQLAR
ncbi:hypothetical protein DIPPA_27941 [Diplonema papillatum]|nr:hypothetical protein DIPPA_27941 [Diplonema papillatum]